jgi:transposase-like protein
MQQDAMNLREFMDRFHTEEDCREYFSKLRWPEGFKCPKCGHRKYSFIKYRNLYQCLECNYQASLTAGTVMHKSHTGLREWFLAIYLFTHDKRGISATQLSKTVGISYYTAWLMLQKLRHAMSSRDAEYYLKGIVEMDDVFLGAPTENGKRGRGTDKTPAIVSLALDEEGRPEYVKVQIIDTVNGATVADTAKATVQAGCTIRTDGLNSYNSLNKEGYEHQAENFNPENNPEHLHWLHVIVSNLKAFITGTYHGLDKKHLQLYVIEFCYRFNRRRFGSRIFHRLLTVCASTTAIITYPQLVGDAASDTTL